MKTVSKKLVSLLLVAIMLVAALPFQAFADDDSAASTKYNVMLHWMNSTTGTEIDKVFLQTATITLGDVKAKIPEGYTYVGWYKDAGMTEAVEGDSVTLESNSHFYVKVTPPAPAEKCTITVTVKVGPAGADTQYTKAFTAEKGSTFALNDALIKEVFAGYDAAKYTNNGWYPYYKDSFVVEGDSNPQIRLTAKEQTGGDNNQGSDNNQGESNVPGTNGYTVYFDFGVAGLETVTKTMYNGVSFENYLPSTPTSKYMKFERWVYADTGVQIDYDKLDVTKDKDNSDGIQIKAIWTMNVGSYVLTLNYNYPNSMSGTYKITVGEGEPILPILSKYNPTCKGYVFTGWKVYDKYVTESTTVRSNATVTAQWEVESEVPGVPVESEKDGVIKLWIYTNGDTDFPYRSVDITSYAKDNKITRAEVKTVVAKYLTAKSGYTLQYEGLFDWEDWDYYVAGGKVEGDDEIVVDLYGDRNIFVMVKNVKASSSSTADSSNPKTGDAGIMMPLFALVSSAASAAYVFTKKRH